MLISLLWGNDFCIGAFFITDIGELMKELVRLFRLLLFLLLVGLSLPGMVSAGFEEGKAAFENEDSELAFQFERGKAALDNRDFKVAIRKFKVLAEKGHAGGQFYLASCYARGIGVDLDFTKAVKWYRKAADQDDALSQAALASMYGNGYGVNKSNLTSLKWNILAALNGHKDSANHLLMMTFFAILSLVFYAFVLRFATKLNAGFKPSFISALYVEIVVMIALTLVFDVALSFVLNIISDSQPILTGAPRTIFRYVVKFLLMIIIYGRLLKHPDTGPIGSRKACYVSLAVTAVGIALFMLLWVFAAVFGVFFVGLL